MLSYSEEKSSKPFTILLYVEEKSTQPLAI